MEQLLINRIYHAIEGEGARIGIPQIFVRVQGCTVGCLNCDSMETWEFSGDPVYISDIKRSVDLLTKKQQAHWISLTGGDPLHPKHEKGLIALSKQLKESGYKINIEASGTRIPKELFSLMDYISCDFKTPSTGVKTPIKVLSSLIENYSDKYQIKSVVSDKKDFEASLEMYQQLQDLNQIDSINWFITPCFETGEDIPKQRIQDIYEWVSEFPSYFRVVSQQHKFIFGSNRLDV